MRRVAVAILLVSLMGWGACVVPAWVSAVEADAEVAAPMAGELIAVIDPALAPLVAIIEGGFSALAKTLDTYKAAPTATNLQAVQAAFAAVQANVAQLEGAAQIKDAATDAKVTAIVQLLNQAVTEIAALVPASAGYGVREAGNGNPPAAAPVKHWKAKDFKREFNRIVAGDARFKLL